MSNSIEIEDDIFSQMCIISIPTMGILLAEDNSVDLIALYMFYYKQCKIQKTNSSWTTNSFASKGLGISEDRISKASRKLNELGLIEYTQDNNGGFGKRYIRVRWLISHARINAGPQIHGTADSGSNALRYLNKNAGSEKRETANPHIEEKKPKKSTKSKRSSSIREGTDTIGATYVPPTKEHIDEVLGKKRGVDKFYEILTLENMKDTKIFELDNPEDPLTFTKLISLYEWIVMFFQEKYDGKIYKDNEGKMVGSNIILNELDKFIAYYAEKPDEHILDLKARLRKWITNSLKYSV